MVNFADGHMVDNNRNRYVRSGIWWAIIFGMVVLVLLGVVAVVFRDRGSPNDPQFLGAWTVTLSDGTTQDVMFNPDGTISANDNVVYRWTGTSTEVCIDTCERPSLDLSRPKTIVKYLIPDRGHIVLTPAYSLDGKEVTLVGDAVRLCRKVESANPG